MLVQRNDFILQSHASIDQDQNRHRAYNLEDLKEDLEDDDDD